MIPNSEALQAMLDNATPGPWEAHAAADDSANISAPGGESRLSLHKWHGMIECYGNEEATEEVSHGVAKANADLCSIARLLAEELIRLRAKVAAQE